MIAPMGLLSVIQTNPADPRVLFLISGLLIILTGLFLLSLFRTDTLPEYLIGLYLLSTSQIVILFEIASLFHRVNEKGFILAGNLFFFAISLISWFVSSRPRLLDIRLTKDRFGKLASVIKNNPALTVFLFFILAGYGYAAYLIINVPQNVDDVLSTYLARVGFWLQYGSFLPWTTSAYNLPQVVFPANPQILSLWIVLFSGTDQLTGFLQWLASIITIVAIYGLARMLKQSIAHSIFVSCLFITIPAVALELSTAQTDLMATVFFVCGVFLLYSGWKNDRNGVILLSALSFALGIGTKQTVLFSAPGLLVSFLLLFFRLPANRWKKTGMLAGGLTVFFILTGAYFYIQNLIFFGKILGPATVEETYTGIQNISFFGRVGMGLGNFFQFFLSSFFSEFFANQIKPIIALNPPLLGDVTEFSELITTYSAGTIGILVTYLSVYGIWSGFQKIKKEKDPIAVGLLACGLVYLLILCFIRQYSASIFRYSLFSFALFLPLIGEADYFKIDARSRLIFNERLGVVIVASLFILGWTLTADKAKSLYNQIALPGMNRTEKQMVLMPEFSNTYRYLDELIPADSFIGLVGTGKYPVSPLFGKYYTRRVEQFVPSEDYHINLDENALPDFLLIDSILVDGNLTIPDGYLKLTTRNDFTIYKQVKK
jgi:4-amino-4-deoxy-L-arabinose transferase-like glycosyltransferase